LLGAGAEGTAGPNRVIAGRTEADEADDSQNAGQG